MLVLHHVQGCDAQLGLIHSPGGLSPAPLKSSPAPRQQTQASEEPPAALQLFIRPNVFSNVQEETHGKFLSGPPTDGPNPCQIKPLSPLKSSDRRRTADQIIADFAIDIPAVSHVDPEDLATPAAGLTALRRSILPDNALSARFTTTVGPALTLVSGTVYVGSHEGTSGEQRILWVKFGDNMFPTVYTLWHNPGIIPLLHTPHVVVEKLQAGADLMTPGLQHGPPFPAKATKGAIVAIASLEAPTVPMAVGTCEINVSALDSVQGVKGHAVSTFHWAGDELWLWSSTGKPGREPPDIVHGWDEHHSQDKRLAEQVAAVHLDDRDGGVTLDPDSTQRSEAEFAQDLSGEDAPTNKDFIDVVEDKELTTKGKALAVQHRVCVCIR